MILDDELFKLSRWVASEVDLLMALNEPRCKMGDA